MSRVRAALSNDDGRVIARLAKAKAFGIPLGKPAFGRQKLLRRRDAAWTRRPKRFIHRSRPIIA